MAKFISFNIRAYMFNFMFCSPCISIYSFKEKKLDAQFIFSIFLQTHLQVSGVSIAYHQEVNRVVTTVGTYCSFQMTVCCAGRVGTQPVQQKYHLKRTVSSNCCIHTVYLLMMGYRYARNMQRCLKKHTEDKLCIKLFF